MEYTQILSEKKCKGKTIDRIVNVWNDTYFIFTDKTYCIYNVNFDKRGTELRKAINYEEMAKLGFITTAERDKIKESQKLIASNVKRKREIAYLKELLEKYPEVIT